MPILFPGVDHLHGLPLPRPPHRVRRPRRPLPHLPPRHALVAPRQLRRGPPQDPLTRAHRHVDPKTVRTQVDHI